MTSMIHRSFAFALRLIPALAIAPVIAMASAVQVEVVDQSGTPVPDAVITAVPSSGKLPPRGQGKAIIDQIHRQFVPLVSVIQTGTLVTFPNKDNIEHDVYSFSPAKTFELNLYSGVAAKPVEFDKPGLVILGCNIHDKMIAYVQVVDTPYFSKTDAMGHANLSDLPTDSYDITAWSYRSTDPKTVAHLSARSDATTPVHFALQLQSN
jgi:plastocyanin